MKRFSGNSEFDAGGQMPTSPDCTDAVMSRLGFKRMDDSSLRRERLRSRSMRVGSFVFLLAVVLFGVVWDRAGQEIGATPTLPAAVNESQAVRAQALAGLAAPFQQLERALDSAIDSWGAAPETLGIERSEEAVKPVDVPENNSTSPAPLDVEKAIAPFSQS